MSDVNQNGQNSSQGDEFDDVLKMFNDYEKKSNQNSNKQNKEDILAKYFTPRNDVEVFRMLPPLKNRDVIEKAFFHYVPVNKATAKGKGYRKIYCPAHNSPKVPKLDGNGNEIKDQNGKPVLVTQKCALCEKSKAIKANVDNSIKGIKKENLTKEQKVVFEKNRDIFREAGQWEAKMYYIIRGIDKGSPKDGVKFWRFKDNWKKQGVHDKLIPALKMFFQDYETRPYDIEKGTDLSINVVDSSLPKGGTYKDVSSISSRKPSKLHEDPIVVKQWVNDPITWRDVYKEATMTKVLSSQEYLERVAKGTDPYYDDRDQDNKKYVFPDPADSELEKEANSRTDSLEANGSSNMEMASDIVAGNVVNESYNVNISNVTSNDVGSDVDDSVDVGSEFREKGTKKEEPVTQTDNVVEDSSYEEEENYDDLPF